MPDLIETASAAFSPLYGKPCWNAKRGYGSFITLEFGDPHLEIHEPVESPAPTSPAVQRLLARRRVCVHGQWHLWIYCCNWLVTSNGQRVGESSSMERMEKAVLELDGQALVRVETDLRRGRWFFEFDLGGRLESRPYSRTSKYHDPSDRQWLLYAPSGCVLTVRADGAYTYQPGNTPPEQQVWITP